MSHLSVLQKSSQAVFCWLACVWVIFGMVASAFFSPFAQAALPPDLKPLESRLVVTEQADALPLASVLQILKETEPLPDLMQSTDWRPHGEVTWLQAGQQATTWYRFGLDNATSASRVLVLEFPGRWVQGAHLFVFDHGRQQYRAVLGEPSGGTGSLALGKLAFPLMLEANSILDVYVRVEGLPLPLESIILSPERRFLLGEMKVSMTAGLVFGVLTCLLILGLVAGRVLRVREYFYLSAYCFLVSIYLLTEFGYDLQLIWSSRLDWHHMGATLLSFAPLGALTYFLYRALPTQVAQRLMGTVVGMCVASVVLCLTVSEAVHYGLAPLYVPALCFAGVLCIKRFGGQKHFFGQAFFTQSLLWLGAVLLVSWGISAFWPKQAFLAHSVAWLGHLSLLFFAAFSAHRTRAISHLRQRLRNIESTHQKAKLEDELLYQTMYDPLTGCPNRVAILHCLEKLINQDPKKEIYVCLIYLDRFKEINNTLGHHNGDELLKRVARRLSGLATQLPGIVNLELKEDKISPLAAIDGVVFGLVLHDLSPELLQNTGEQVLRSLSYPFEFKKMTLDISAFIGVAGYPAHGKGPSELLQHAYVAVELAQQQDSSILYYTQELDPYSARRLTLVGELKHALRSNELEIYYQPQLEVKQDLVIGVEALIRWIHPEHGFISPAEFIPVAEKTGVIKQLTAWVLERAIQDAAHWYEQGIFLRVSVNLSAKNLQESDLPSQVISLLHKYRLPPEAIALEITETAMMHDPARALKIITELHDFGIRLSVDDFGTGYSSLAYLKQLPVAEIKIDRSFVGEMCRNTDDQVIVNTTLNMSHNLGLEVVAEGVEDERTLVALKRLGCDVAQGYFIAKPMNLSSIGQWLISTHHNVIRTEENDDGSRATG